MSEEHPGQDATTETVAVVEERVVVLPAVAPLPGRIYNWIDLSRREIPPGWVPATISDVGNDLSEYLSANGVIVAGTMALAFSVKDDELRAQAREAQAVLDKIPGNRPVYIAPEADSLEAAVRILAERFKLVPFDPEHFGLGKDPIGGGLEVRYGVLVDETKYGDQQSAIPPGKFDYPGVGKPIEVTTDPEVLFLSKRRAVADWLGRVLEAAQGCSTIYWRIEPELKPFTAIANFGQEAGEAYRIYSRFSAV
jgi:hypothetical protein